MTEKNILREKAKALRTRIVEKKDRNCIEVKSFLNLILKIKKKFDVKSVGIYYPIQSELSPLKLIEVCNKLGLKVCLPVMKRSLILSFREWNGKEKLITSTFGILEPSKEKMVIEPNILFVPLLAYDKNFNRLGYGRGYYDKTIFHFRKKNEKKTNSFLVIGLAYDKQELKYIPVESHDEKLDIIMTEKKILCNNKNNIL